MYRYKDINNAMYWAWWDIKANYGLSQSLCSFFVNSSQSPVTRVHNSANMYSSCCTNQLILNLGWRLQTPEHLPAVRPDVTADSVHLVTEES